MPDNQTILSERLIIWLVAAVQFLNIVDFMMIMPLGPDLATALDIAPSDIASITAAYTFAAAISAIVSAKKIDQFSRKPALLFFILGLSSATMIASLAHTGTQLLLCRVLAGCFAGPATSVAFSLLIDNIPEERRGRAMGKVMGAFSVAAVAGVPIGMQLTIWFSWQAPFITIGCSGLVVLFIILLKLPPQPAKNITGNSISITRLLSQPAIRSSYLMTAGAMFAGFLLIPNFSAYFQYNLGYPHDSIGTLYLTGGIGSFFAMRLSGHMVDRFGSTPVGWFAWVLSAGTILISLVLHQPIPLLLFFILFMSANGARNVAIQALASKVPPASMRGAYMSLQSATRHLSTGGAALLSSQILTTADNGSLIDFNYLAAITIAVSLLVPVSMIITQQRMQLVHHEKNPS
ncbi:sugar efflux transporter [Sinobacterium norvegicum]|uniref:Sugar efflux transporter n=1 Tax=Sinobacterium norvegicum TaxID=1641715 RepID=A0ABN8EII3_9GAMM|nr:MFS transporter [Sinobacterium norvegicum]CAH0991495.1 sugar efflux transporter [Sinobacterium norvegicum]